MPNFAKAAIAITLLASLAATGSVAAGEFHAGQGQERRIIIVGGAPQEKPFVAGGEVKAPAAVQSRIKFQSRFFWGALNPQPLPPKERR